MIFGHGSGQYETTARCRLHEGEHVADSGSHRRIDRVLVDQHDIDDASPFNGTRTYRDVRKLATGDQLDIAPSLRDRAGPVRRRDSVGLSHPHLRTTKSVGVASGGVCQAGAIPPRGKPKADYHGFVMEGSRMGSVPGGGTSFV